MSNGVGVRHVVAIAGVVREARAAGITGYYAGWEGRIANALVEIVAGPPAFQTMLTTLAANPARGRKRRQIDRTRSQADGVFYFLDLPAGEYRLRISAPDRGTRYGSVETDPITAAPAPVGTPVQAAWIEVTLPVTRVHGVVTVRDTGAPVAGANVQLRGDTEVVRTAEDGSYELIRLVQGKPLVEATATNFNVATRRVTLAPGQDRTVNFRLEPS